MKQKLLSLLLAAAMALTMAASPVFAVDEMPDSGNNITLGETQQPGSEEEPTPPVCNCTTLCTGEGPNTDCPVCAENPGACTGEEEKTDGAPEGGQSCICETLCTEGSVNGDCPVCGAEGADLAQCLGTGGPDAEDAEPGDTVKANAKGYDRMPWSVMEALRQSDNVTLHITWNGGEDIIIPSEAALREQSRIYDPLAYLEDIDFTVKLEVEPEAPAYGPGKVNPNTGGILEVTAPATADAITIPAGEPEIAEPQRGLAVAPELAEKGIEQAMTDNAAEETGASGLLIAGVVAVLAAAVGGFWF